MELLQSIGTFATSIEGKVKYAWVHYGKGICGFVSRNKNNLDRGSFCRLLTGLRASTIQMV